MNKNVIILFMTALILLTGCRDFSKQHEKSEYEEAVTTNVVTEGENERKQERNEQKTITSKATYIGLTDSHTIEVIINHEPIAIQINEEQRKIVEPLETNEQIHIEYSINDKTSQHILIKVKIRK